VIELEREERLLTRRSIFTHRRIDEGFDRRRIRRLGGFGGRERFMRVMTASPRRSFWIITLIHSSEDSLSR
jgi:hypothetical protein